MAVNSPAKGGEKQWPTPVGEGRECSVRSLRNPEAFCDSKQGEELEKYFISLLEASE